MKRNLCSDCNRALGGTGIPSAAIPSMPELTIRGGIYSHCDGQIDNRDHGMVHLDHMGLPMDKQIYADYRASLEQWEDPIAGSSLLPNLTLPASLRL